MIQYSTINNKHITKSEYLGEEVYNLLDSTFAIPSNYSFNIFEVTEEYIARPDLVSLDAYGDSMFADVICKLNGISNPFELNVGMKIIVPSPENILDFTFSPTTQDMLFSSSGADQKGPVAKTKNEKRKPNEAIVGDVRFKIDPGTGIIIY